MEQVPCPITGDRDFTPWLDAPDRFDQAATPWKLVRSSSSGLVMLNPRPSPSESPRYYPASAYDPFLADGNSASLRDHAYLLASSALLGLKARIVLKGLRKPASSASVLDAGCSTGRLLLRIHRAHGVPACNLWGVEQDHGAAESARRSGVRQLVESGFVEARLPGGFDRIVFWHSLEHLHQPGIALGKAADLLAEGGNLVIAVPNIGSPEAVRYDADWVALDAPRHLWHFTPLTLEKLLGRHGLRIVSLSAYPPDTLYNVWYSERLARARTGKRFGVAGAARATVEAARSLAAAIKPENASVIICRAVRSRG
jgi:SAM-dependent methyltransferase